MKNAMKKTMSLLLAFILAMGIGFVARPTHAYAAETQDIVIFWHHYDTGKGFYNPDDEGKEVEFLYAVFFDGYDEDNNKVENLYSTFRKYSGKIGEETTIQVPTDEIETWDGKVYKNCTIKEVYIPVYNGNYIYAGSITNKDGKPAALMCQNINLQTEASTAQDAIILDSDKDNMPIRFTISMEKNGQTTYPLLDKQNKTFEHVMDFVEGPMEVWNDNSANDGSISGGIFGNSFNLFSPYTGKYQTFELHADFTGDNKAALDERYNLTVAGNDLDGWKLELTSNIKKGEKVETKDLDFETVIEYSSDIPVGQEVVKQEGQKGLKKITTPYYYLTNKDGSEKVLETLESKEQITEPVKQIIVKGTKAGMISETPTLELKEESSIITVGDKLDLKSLIKKAEIDGENAVDQVVIDKGNFDNTKAGEYEITYTLVNQQGAKVRKTTKVAVKNMIKLSFDYNLVETPAENQVIMAKYGEEVTIPAAPVREGYEFLYWKGSVYHPGDKYTAVEDHNFVAQWKLAEESTKPSTEESTKPSTEESTKPSTAETSKTKVPQTGESVAPYVLSVVLLGAAAVTVMVKKKAKED